MKGQVDHVTDYQSGDMKVADVDNGPRFPWTNTSCVKAREHVCTSCFRKCHARIRSQEMLASLTWLIFLERSFKIGAFTNLAKTLPLFCKNGTTTHFLQK
jgi:hypothetical protein